MNKKLLSGHSKWSKIKHQKSIKDAKRGKIFSQLSREIMMVAKNGADLNTNYQLKLVVQKAKAEGLPKENIDRAILKGSGGGEDVKFEEIIYEGFCAGGVGIVVKILTNNKNRALQNLRLVFDKNGGNLANPGTVTFNFDFVGEIVLPNVKISDELEEMLIELDVKNYEFSEDGLIVYTDPKNLFKTFEEIEKFGLKPVSSELVFLPKNLIEISDENRKKLESLLEKIEDLDDVVGVWSNEN